MRWLRFDAVPGAGVNRGLACEVAECIDEAEAECECRGGMPFCIPRFDVELAAEIVTGS